MSDIFENDIDIPNMDLASLEDPNAEDADQSGLIVFNEPLYKLKLAYSSESLYAHISDFPDLTEKSYVVVPTRFGKDIALVLGKTNKPVGVKKDDVVRIDRKANSADIERMNGFKEKENQAYAVFKEKAAMHNLEMKLIATHYMLEEQKILFFFSAESRVDFRDLVKDLVSIFKMRIELRQIGVRDESRITGGLGVCGRPYCCHSVSDKLRPVSIRMAKDQNLSLNSMKISGQCGRLLCCFSYEHDWYTEARRSLPNEGIKLFYDGTVFRVTEVNPLTSMVRIQGDDGRALEISAANLEHKENKWKIKDTFAAN